MLRNPSIFASLRHAFRGLKEVARSERNFRFHLLAATIVITCGLLFQISKAEWLFIVIVIAAVMILEVLNAVVERLVDLVKPRLHPILRDLKDMMAGAVLLAAATALAIGGFIFLPKIIAELGAWGIIKI